MVLQWTVIQWVSCESTLVNHVSVRWRAQVHTDLVNMAAHYRICAMMRINTESLTGVTTARRSSAKNKQTKKPNISVYFSHSSVFSSLISHQFKGNRITGCFSEEKK